jgi:molybdate transport system permease protein
VRTTARRPLIRADSTVLIAAPASLFILFIIVPLIALIWRAAVSGSFLQSLSTRVVADAVRLTLETTACTLLLVLTCGTPLAYLLARRSFTGKRLVETLIDFPLILPPVVAGVALLMAFGRRGLLGHQLGLLGIELPFTTAAVILAQTFVAAPFYVHGARVGFSAVDLTIEEAAAIDGASPMQGFLHVTAPLALPGIATGALLCLGRAISEFGATLLFAGNLEGRTQTMSLAIVQAMQTDLSSALALAVLLVVSSGVVLIVSRALLGTRVEF